MKVVFLGTPDFAVPSLLALNCSRHKIVAVVTQPDRPVGRKAVITPSPVKVIATKLGLKVLQYEKISRDGVSDLKSLNADIMVTCAFGQILSAEVLNAAKYGVINVHASLLPKYRGASPVQAAIINGDIETGVTIMQTEVALDSGDILAVCKTKILDNETADALSGRLSEFGANLLVETLDKIESGKIKGKKQDDNRATFVKPIKKQDALINWNDSAKKIKDLVRGMNPWPVAYTFFNGKIMKIFSVKTIAVDFTLSVGALKNFNGSMLVGCGDGVLSIEELQMEGGKKMTAHDFLLGRNIDGVVLKDG